MRATGRPLWAALRRRLYATQAAAQAQHGEQKLVLHKQDPKISRLSSGTVVASVENYSPIARVAVVVNAGSRFETAGNKGAAHSMRIVSNLSTTKSTSFGVTRNIQQIGGSLTCTTSREHITYTLETLRDNLDIGMEYLGHVALQPAFKIWELTGANQQLKFDLAMLHHQPHVELIEALHKAAYRESTLGGSIFTPEHRVGRNTPDVLRDYMAQNYTSSRVALVGVGVDHDQLLQYSKQLTMPVGTGAEAQKAVFGGGEVRIDTGNPLVHAAVVTEGVSLSSKDIIALAVLHQAIGTGPHIKRSNNLATSKINQAVAQATSAPFAASSINVNYSDSGLFGFSVITQATDADKVLKSITSQFANITKTGVSDKEVQTAKYQLKAGVSMSLEDSGQLVEELGIQAQITGQVLTLEDITQAIDKVTTTEVNNIAKKVINGKPAMAAVGDLHNTPYLDQLMSA